MSPGSKRSRGNRARSLICRQRASYARHGRKGGLVWLSQKAHAANRVRIGAHCMRWTAAQPASFRRRCRAELRSWIALGPEEFCRCLSFFWTGASVAASLDLLQTESARPAQTLAKHLRHAVLWGRLNLKKKDPVALLTDTDLALKANIQERGIPPDAAGGASGTGPFSWLPSPPGLPGVFSAAGKQPSGLYDPRSHNQLRPDFIRGPAIEQSAADYRFGA